MSICGSTHVFTRALRRVCGKQNMALFKGTQLGLVTNMHISFSPKRSDLQTIHMNVVTSNIYYVIYMCRFNDAALDSSTGFNLGLVWVFRFLCFMACSYGLECKTP